MRILRSFISAIRCTLAIDLPNLKRIGDTAAGSKLPKNLTAILHIVSPASLEMVKASMLSMQIALGLRPHP